MGKDSKFKISIQTLFSRQGLAKAISGFKSLTATIKGMGRASVNAFATIKTGINSILKPLKVFMAVVGAGGGIFAAFAASSIKAAAAMETLRTQLKAVMATKREADKAFAESVKFSVKTPFTPQEIVETRVALEGVGIAGQGAVEAVATTAAALNKNILDVASSLKSLETEPLRGLGIMLERNGGQFLFKYKDKMKQAQQVSATGFEQAQAALMAIMLEKFGGGLDEMSATFNGKLSTLKGAFDLFKADFGNEFLPSVKRVLDDLIEALTGNNLTKFGQKIDQHIENARIKVIAAFQTAQEASKIIKDNLATGGTGFGRIVNAVIVNIVDSLFKGLVAAIKASLEVWKLVGVTIVSAIKEELMKLDLPGMGKARRKAAVGAVGEMSNEEARQYMVENGIYSNQFLNDMPNVSGDEFKGLLMGAIDDGGLGKGKEAQLASRMDGRMVDSALKNFAEGMKSTVSDLRKDLDMNLGKVGQAVKNTTGVDFNFEGSYNRNKATLWQERKRELEREQEKAQGSSGKQPVESVSQRLAPLGGDGNRLREFVQRQLDEALRASELADSKKGTPEHGRAQQTAERQQWEASIAPGMAKDIAAASSKQNEQLAAYLRATGQNLDSVLRYLEANNRQMEDVYRRLESMKSEIRTGRS